MQKVGIKFEKVLDYERFESLQYWLNYEFEYEDLEAYIKEEKIIELEFEEDEDRAEDIEMLQAFLSKFDKEEIKYEILVLNNEWNREKLNNIV